MTLRLAVLGDSIAYGVGADHPSHTLAQRLTTELARRDVDVQARVFAAPGARSADLARQVARALPWRPGLAVTVIGANDLTHLVPPDQASHALRDAVRRLREAGTEVVVAPAPDLSMVPHVPPAFRATVQAASRVLRDAQVRVTQEEGGRVADEAGETSAAFRRDRSLFSRDRFHPSSAGYEVIAGSLLPVVVEAVSALSGH